MTDRASFGRGHPGSRVPCSPVTEMPAAPESHSASCLSLLSGTAVSVLGVNCEAQGRGHVL